MKKKLLLSAMALISLAGLIWLYSHAYIEILPVSANNVSYTLTSLSDDKSRSFNSTTGLKKLVSRGSYQVLAQNGETSYFKIVKAGGFLGSTTISPKLSSEKARKFIGDNPGDCAYYTGQVLASGACEDLFSQLNLHVPARAQQATYTQKLKGRYDGIVGGIAHTKLGMIALLRSTTGSGHSAHKVNDDFSLAGPIVLGELDKGKLYSLQPYKEGFLTHDRSLGHLQYYSSLQSRPASVNIHPPKDKKLQAYALKTRGESIAIGYTDHPEDIALARGDEEHLPTKPPKKTKVAILVTAGDEIREYTFGKRIASFEICGPNRLCTLDTSNMFEVYDISGKKNRQIFAINGIETFAVTNNAVVLAARDSILSLDTETREGYIQYSFSSYRFCGMYKTSGGYALCVINNSDQAAALYIDPDQNNTDSIDKKVADLAGLQQVKSISAYGNFIFISPNLGEAEYRPELKSFGYNPVTIKAVNSVINQTVDLAGIDRAKYTVFNPYQ